MIVHSTAGCRRTPWILVAFEETSLPYRLVTQPDGYFERRFGRLGPCVEDEDLRLFEFHAILRHLARMGGGGLVPSDPRLAAMADERLDSLLGSTRPAVMRWVVALRTGSPDLESARAALDAALACLEEQTPLEAFMLGEFSIVDCAMVPLLELRAAAVDVGRFSRLGAYLERLRVRRAGATPVGLVKAG